EPVSEKHLEILRENRPFLECAGQAWLLAFRGAVQAQVEPLCSARNDDVAAITRQIDEFDMRMVLTQGVDGREGGAAVGSKLFAIDVFSRCLERAGRQCVEDVKQQ